jgi:magnesium-transporting ATPase (P-type)
VDIFQDYSDTVISVGLSHLTSNDKIFSVADIAVGIDTLCCSDTSSTNGDVASGHVLATELEFVSSIAARSCAFRFRGDSSVAHIATVIEQSRTALEAAVAASSFVLFGFLSYSFFVLFSVCVPSTLLPYIPVLGTVLFLQGVLPALGFVMAMSNGDTDIMKRVPPKNDQSVTFARKEGWKLYTIVILKAIPPALLPQVLHLIVFGELLLHFEPDLAADSCPGAASWVDVVRCKDLQEYSGPAKISSGILVFTEMALCVVVASMGFLSRMETLFEHPPWKRNVAWVICLPACIAFIILYGVNAVDLDIREALPWYYYLLVVILPLLCLVWVETCKKSEARFESRAEKLRRLQFETRLGAWSPK